MKKFYAYVFRDKNNQPFYVGKGSGNRVTKNRGTKTHLGRKIAKMKREGNEHSVEIITALDEEHAKFLEICLIQIFGRADLNKGPLLNLTDGGDGRITWSEEQKIAHSLKITGQKRTPETKLKMSKSALDNLQTIEDRMKKAKNFGCAGGQKKGAIAF
jgi:hypothetical protein